MQLSRHLTPLLGLGLAALGAFGGATAGPAEAQVVFSGGDLGAGYTDSHPVSNTTAASFDLAAGTLGTEHIITFEAAPVGAFSNLTVAPGVGLTGADGNFQAQHIANAPRIIFNSRLYGYNTTSGGANFVDVNGGNIVFTFAQPVQSFGGYFTGVQSIPGTISFNDGTAQSVPISGDASGGAFFVGFTDAGKSISSITLVTGMVSGAGDIIGVDDVRYVISAPSLTGVPEPSSVVAFGFMGLGAGALMLRARKRRAA